MNTEHVFGIIHRDLITLMISYYDSVGTYRTESMRKADPGPSTKWVDPILRDHFPFLHKMVGGNYYKHRAPYLIHTDHQLRWGEPSVNCIIPLSFEGSPPNLIVFDQQWFGDSCTWSAEHEKTTAIASSSNGQVPGAPYQYNITNKTGKPVDHNFWVRHLSKEQQYYHDLSGSAFPFVPGSVIMFDNTRLHCTGKFHGVKLGLSLRYTIK